MSGKSLGIKSKTIDKLKNLWRTSEIAYDDACYLCGVAEFDVDAAATADDSKCLDYISDALGDRPFGWFSNPRFRSAWCNPPFDLKVEFLSAAYQNRKFGLICMMLPFEPATRWWREYVSGKASFVFIPDGRYNYLHPETGEEIKGVNFASAFVVFTSIKAPTQYIEFARGISNLT